METCKPKKLTVFCGQIETIMKKLVPILALLCAFGTQKAAAQPGRWYSYYDYLDYDWGGNIAWTPMAIWNDTTSIQHYYSSSSGDYYFPEKFTSVGMSFAPRLSYWNNYGVFSDAIIKVGPTDVFTIDSVRLHGQYFRNLSKPSVKDTLRLAFVYGDGSPSSNLPVNTVSTSYSPYTVNYLSMFYDSVKNKAGKNTTGATPYTQDIVLTNTDTATFFDRVYALTTPYSVPAGQIAATSLTFKTGDPSWTLGDTVEYLSRAMKYGAFYPAIGLHYTSSGIAFPTPSSLDSNVGYFKRPTPASLGWNDKYIPTWSWYSSTSASGAADLQYPRIDFHINCPTCELATGISSTMGSTLCVGDTDPYTHLAPGGTWSSSNAAVASVSSSGLVTAVSAGSATITYAIGTNIATLAVYVSDPNPVITGPSSVCVGNTITLSGGAGFTGPWTSSATSVATVTTGAGTGAVTGVAAGTTTISFSTWTGICGAGMGTYNVTVETLPDAGTLSGGDTVCLNSSATITPSVAGGTWSTSNANAFVSGGTVSGVAAGMSIVTYTVSNMCGSSNVQQLVNVVVCPTGVGNVANEATISVAPNPTSDDITITGSTKINSVAVYNVTGQKVFSGNYNSRSVNVSMKELPAGIYTIRVNEGKIYRVVRQ